VKLSEYTVRQAVDPASFVEPVVSGFLSLRYRTNVHTIPLIKIESTMASNRRWTVKVQGHTGSSDRISLTNRIGEPDTNNASATGTVATECPDFLGTKIITPRLRRLKRYEMNSKAKSPKVNW
jgi:hypothetical protein